MSPLLPTINQRLIVYFKLQTKNKNLINLVKNCNQKLSHEFMNEF